MEKETKQHESYGMVGISRVTSSHPVNLFGSSIQHKNTIRLTICEAEHNRDLSRDWYFATKTIIEVELSQSQFAEMITSPNIGDGVPCTIVRRDGKLLATPDFESKKDMFSKEFREQMQTVADENTLYMKEALDILENKSSMNKGDRETVKKAIKMLLQEIKSNLPFTYDQFQKQMDKTVTEAKGEIEAFVEHKIRSTGLEALKDTLLLGDGQ